jgi:hypothetical protein
LWRVEDGGGGNVGVAEAGEAIAEEAALYHVWRVGKGAGMSGAEGQRLVVPLGWALFVTAFFAVILTAVGWDTFADHAGSVWMFWMFAALYVVLDAASWVTWWRKWSW